MSTSDQKTSIVVESSDPPPQPVESDIPHALIVGDLSGCRDEDAQPDWTAHDVSAANYEQFLARHAKPRFRGTVPDHLSGQAGARLAVDVTFERTTPHWPQELDEKVPEFAAIVQLIRDVERLKRHLAQQVAVRNRLESLLGSALDVT